MKLKILNATPGPLPLPDGREAREMNVHELCRELGKLGLPVTTAMGKEDLLKVFSDSKQAALAEFSARWNPGEAIIKSVQEGA